MVQTDIKEPTEGTKLCCFLKNGDQKKLSNLKYEVCNIEPKFKEKNLSQDDLQYMLNCLRKKRNIPTVQFNPIAINEKFTTRSEVEVINQDNKVEIKKGGRILDFQEALTHYYDYNFENLANLAGELSHSPTRKTLEKFKAIPNIDKEVLQRLKDSTYLCSLRCD